MKKFLFIIFAACLFLSSCTQKPSYKIPKYDPNQKSKTVISENNINTQVLISFRNDISHSEACCWLKEHDAKILDANEQFNYYLVRTHSEQAAEALISQCETPIVDCAVRNMFLDPCAVKMHAIDHFDDSMKNESIFTHGDMVKEIMEDGVDYIYVSAHNIQSGNNISMDKLSSEFLDICEQMNDTDMTIVNFSLGISQYEDKEKTKLKPQETFYQDYANEVRWYANLAHKCGNKNFIITKAMGNESMHSIDEAFQLSLERMNDNQRKALKEHMIIVSAKDTRKEFPVGYSNTINHKIEGVNTIMVDISDKPLHQSGTSAAAPLVANWIAKSGFTNASDVIEAINESTQNGELVSNETFQQTAQKIVNQRKIYDTINELSLYSEFTVEGVLKIAEDMSSPKITTTTLSSTISAGNNIPNSIEKDLVGQTIYEPSSNGYFPKDWRWILKEGEVLNVSTLECKQYSDGLNLNVLAHLHKGKVKVDAEIEMQYGKANGLQSITMKKIIIPSQTDYSQYVKLKMDYDFFPTLRLYNNSDMTLFIGGDYSSGTEYTKFGGVVEPHSSKPVALGSIDSYHIHFAYKK